MEIKEDGNCFHEVKITDQDGLLRTIKVPVVQQLALNGLKHLPDRYINVPPDHPVVSYSVPDPSQTFPAIDVAQLTIGPRSECLGRAQELVKLARVAKEWGLFLIINHGIEDSVLRGVEDVVRGFFGLSFEEKKLSVGTYMNVDNMGYGHNFVRSENQRLTWIDRLAMKAAPREASEGLHVWPQNPANFRQVMEEYVEGARKVCNHLLEALAESLSLEKHVFLRNLDSKSSEINVRVNYYPQCPRPDLSLGITPHSDGSALTFLMQFGATGGLQVLKDAKWVTVPWPENMLLVGVGDLLEIMSNGRLKSAWHRVATKADGERLSVALFFNPPSEAEIEPVKDEGPSNESYKKVIVGDYEYKLMEIKEDGNCFHEVKITDQDGLLRTVKVPVVQQLALNGLKHLPDRFINVPPDHPVVSSSVLDPSQTFPAIDVAQLRIGPESEGPGRAQELVKLARVAKEWGLFLIINHGIEDSVLCGVEDVVRGFFGLSFEEKKLSVGTYMDVDNMGYGQNFVRSENQRLTWIDRLAMKAAPREASEGLHVWPQNPANFRQVMEEYVERARKVCNLLLEALAESLSLEKHVFLRNLDSKSSEINVRVNYYPQCPRPDLSLGITPHSDGSALTFLMQFGATGGLQVLKDAKWVTVPWPENMLLVGVGDLLEIMSNGRLKSAWHRVATKADGERLSVTLFYNPPSVAEIEPVKDEGPSNESYKKVIVGDYMRNYYKISPTIDKQAINFAKI
ncbi:hypothetical protein RHSIM_RhsimUnG0123500 [Rhododendron simsii]|uniref:Fe2OG dioxygenase domain-containing protein n=1 Tax=Rhododendron simsii TaxID=118357 RepID=A0A834FY83_RHOSS|nr:hypothetical protein RHSIM_RhsimUnG0123500 [Rhododendron simsii]